MKIIRNTGNDRVIDSLLPALKSGGSLDVVTPTLSIFAFSRMMQEVFGLEKCRLLLPTDITSLTILGSGSDRVARNCLQTRWISSRFVRWIEGKVEIRCHPNSILQSAFVLRDINNQPLQTVLGAAFSTNGLGVAPNNQLNLIQASDSPQESLMVSQWFDSQWSTLRDQPQAKAALITHLQTLSSHRDPTSIYSLILHRLLASGERELDEDSVVKAATGIRDTVVWKKLFKFQRDGVVGAIDKLNRFGGCIIADSVGLGKTFEALAIIKYHELRNDRVLVIVPKRLRDNWIIYKTNDKRNILATDRLNYDLLNHTDLSRDRGHSGDIDLSHVNWGNYDLVVIDESHNFRNKTTHKGRETRYDRLMRKIIKEGVKTRVLMLSATPVNNRLADLYNQISFVTEGNDGAMSEHGIASIKNTTRRAQMSFNKWLKLPEEERSPTLLIELLGFDYFMLLDHLTIARSRRHIEKYYGTAETGRFPDRLPPINIKADVDLLGEFQSIASINLEIRKLKLASYAPLRYVLLSKQEAYGEKYNMKVRDGESVFRQTDREENLIKLMRVNLLKRMESSVSSFALTVERLLQNVESTLGRIETHQKGDNGEFEELDIADVDIEDPEFELLLVGRKVKVLLNDVDLISWQQDLAEDRDRLAKMLNDAKQVDASRDAKLAKLRELIAKKIDQPINSGNRKIIVFTAFADTAKYLYEHLANWGKSELNLESALVMGSGKNQTTSPNLNKDLVSILTAFSPHSKERPVEFAQEGGIDLLIATDCISEGQNLQDCDYLINYDIHWNPVRIIQRFGRIDRIGSQNNSIQLVNFWPNMELEEYINLEKRVSGRMVLLDISATGEENLIEQQSGDLMNDLEYRRKQLLKLQDAVIDLEDLSSGISITDLTLNNFRIDLAGHLKAHPNTLENMPLGSFSVTTSHEADLEPGVIFCLRAEGVAAEKIFDQNYPLAPYYLVHVGKDGEVLLPYTQIKQILDRLKRLSLGRALPDKEACSRFDQSTKNGEDMRATQQLLATAISSITGKSEERAVASLFLPGGTHALKGEFAGINDFEVVAFFVVLSKDGK